MWSVKTFVSLVLQAGFETHVHVSVSEGAHNSLKEKCKNMAIVCKTFLQPFLAVEINCVLKILGVDFQSIK